MSMSRIVCLLTVLLLSPLAVGQVRVKPAKPLQRSLPVPVEAPEEVSATEQSAPPTTESKISPKEALRLKAIYDVLPEDEQQEMRAHYEAMDIDLIEIFSNAKPGAEVVAVTKRPLLPLISRKKFVRTPKSVLAARTKLGLEVTVRPAEDEKSATVAEWLHLQVMAGEWGELEWFLSERAGKDAEGIYSHVIQSTNSGDPMLLPEEVLALGNSAKDEPTSWQLNVLGQLLKQASQKASTGPMLSQLREGTRLFGGEDSENRARTAVLLARAGMAEEAYEYLPSLDMGRATADEEILLVHALYHADRAGSASGIQKDLEHRTAWEIFGEITLMEDADLKVRQEALKAAMSLLAEVPEAQAREWLDRVFANEQVAPAALEIVALDAMNLRKGRLNDRQKAQSIVVMQTAVARLLDSDRIDSSTLRVPLRMLTTGLVAEAEAALTDKSNRGGTPAGTAMLLRAVPDEAWLESIEPSLAVRASRAFVGIAALADETDMALDILEQGIARHPDEASNLAGSFLEIWIKRLRPDTNSNQTAAMRSMLFAFGGRTAVPAAPLTRGRQARNLNRLERVLELVQARGIDPRSLPNIVGAFQACHSRSETYTEEDIMRVLGPVDELPPATAATLSRAMRNGLGGDWRSREVQQRFGMRRNATEIAQIVEDGYALAIRLIDRAIEEEPDSWQHAMNKAEIAYERLEHRKSQNNEDLANYDELRSASFDAFAEAAASYARAVEEGRIKPTPAVYLAWFNAAIGATNLSQLTRDNILYEGSERDTQIDRIREALASMPPAVGEEHVGMMAQALAGAITSLNPEVKPRVVRHALRIVGEHPSSASLRRVQALYDDLIQDEIRLRLSLDGPVEIGSNEPFGAVLTLRYTNAVDRETDGFSKYLQNNVWVNLGTGSTWVNYRDRLERAIESAFDESYRIEAVSFFDSMHPSSDVLENGERGWQEKPLAYVVMKATDPSIERIPPVQMDLDFIDQTGPVILAVESNSPAVDAAEEPARRPIKDLMVSQVLDVRSAGDGEVILEIQAQGRGVVPELEDLLEGYEASLDGFEIGEGDLEAHPIGVSASDAEDTSRMIFRFSSDDEEEKTYAGKDDDGVYRQLTERSWTIRYTPTGSTVANAMVLPKLTEGSEGELESRYYDDMDLVVAEGTTIPVGGGMSGGMIALMVVVLVVGVVAVIALVVRSRQDPEGQDELGSLLPARDTPLGAIAALKRIDEAYGSQLGSRRTELEADIATLEERYFSPEEVTSGNGDVRAVVDRWAEAVKAGT